MPEENKKYSGHICNYEPDEEAKKWSEAYTRQFYRLHQFPTCLGNAIEAYEIARKLSPDDRQPLHKIFENIVKCIDPVTSENDRKARLDDIKISMETLSKSQNWQDIQDVVQHLMKAYPDPLEQVYRIRPR